MRCHGLGKGRGDDLSEGKCLGPTLHTAPKRLLYCIAACLSLIP